MKTLLACLFALGTALGVVRADEAKLPAEFRHALRDLTRFHELRKVADLPAKVVALIAPDPKFIANPGEKWQVTDVIDDPNLPAKRLIWAATDGEHYIVHYESGGIAHVFHILMVNVAPTPSEPVTQSGAKQYQDLASFAEAMGRK